jgi:hypothetical protein
VEQMQLKHYRGGKSGVWNAFAPRLVRRVEDALTSKIRGIMGGKMTFSVLPFIPTQNNRAAITV